MNEKSMGFIIGLLVGIAITALGFMLFSKNDITSFNPIQNVSNNVINNSPENQSTMPSSSSFYDGNTITTIEDSGDY
ncbi:hypothetical protein D3C72_1780160 [compost metagenome]